MTPEEAKRILAAYRADGALEDDPEVVAALDLVAQDADLRSWWSRQQRFHQSLARSLRAVPVPAELARSLSASPASRHSSPDNSTFRIPHSAFFPRSWLAWAAVFMATALLATLWLRRGPGEDSFATFRSRMVRSALREYRMDVVTNDLTAIRSYLARHDAPSELKLDGGLARLPAVGGGLLSWQGRKVAMVCLADEKQMFYLFVVDQDSVRQPPSDQPVFTQENQLATASWSHRGLSYLLAGDVGERTLRQLF